MRQLVQLTGLKSRELRRCIQRERREVPIISNCECGYFVAETPAEVARFYRSMKRRALEIEITAECTRLAAVEAGIDG